MHEWDEEDNGRGSGGKNVIFQMAPGSILSTQIHKIDHIHTYGAAKVDFFAIFQYFQKWRE